MPPPSLGLHRAASAGNVSLVLYALDNGQPVNQILHGIAPLHVAACMGDVAITNTLISYGADVNIPKAKDKVTGPGVEGATPLHFAAANGHLGVVHTLLVHGARPRPVDRDLQTPESLAYQNQHIHCLSFLRHWMDLYGTDGHVESSSLRPMLAWSDHSLLERSREGIRSRSPLAYTPETLPRRDAMSSSLSSPAPHEPKPRSSFPSLIEKASNPAATIRAALFPSSPSTPRSDENTSSSMTRRVPRISSRASLTGLFRRRSITQSADDAGAAAAAASVSTSSSSSSTATSAATPNDIESARFGRVPPITSSRPDPNSSLRQRSYTKNSTSGTTPPPSIPLLSTLSSPPSKLRHQTDSLSMADQSTRSHISMALASSHLRRLRSNSASSTRGNMELSTSHTRTRANSEAAVQPQQQEDIICTNGVSWGNELYSSLSRDDLGISDTSL